MAGRPAYQIAFDHIKQLIDNAHRQGNAKLPTVRHMARTLSVSQPTILRALGHFRRQGIITTCPGRGIEVIAVASTRNRVLSALPSASLKWERAAHELTAHILARSFGPDSPLPTVKELSQRYGVSYLTMRKVLRTLAHKQVIVQDARGFRSAMHGSHRPNSSIALIAAGEGDGVFAPITTRTQDHLRWIEEACARAGTRLVRVPCVGWQHGKLDPAILAQKLTAVSRDGTMLGAVVWTIALRCDWASFHTSARSCCSRMAFLDETGDSGLSSISGRTTRAQVFVMASSVTSGADVGRWLLARGHRRIAFFSADHQAVFSRNRLHGIVDAFAAAGLPDAVHACTTEDLYHSPEMLAALAESDGLMNRAADRIARAAPRHDSVRGETAASMRTRGVDAAREAITRRALLRHLSPSCSECYDDSRITAWVAVDDATALACRDFLRNQSRRLLIAGFDDSAAASANGVSSYSFNGSAVMQAMVSYVIRPRWQSVHGAKSRPVEIGGYVVERE
jgi:DNA-binding FadR family transcriptional regulator